MPSSNITSDNRKKFKASLKTLLTWLVDKFPDDDNIAGAVALVSTGLIGNLGFVIGEFMESIGPHVKEVMESNDDYFLGNDDEKLGVDPEYAKLSNTLRKKWPNLNDKMKNYLRQTLKILSIKCALATGNKEVIDIINNYVKNFLNPSFHK